MMRTKSAFVLVLLCFCCFAFSCNKTVLSDIPFSILDVSGQFISGNKDSVSGVLTNPQKSLLFGLFTSEQISSISSLSNTQTLAIELKIKANASDFLELGFLYDDDFPKSKKSPVLLKNNSYIKGSLGSYANSKQVIFSLSFDQNKISKLKGFFLKSSSKFTLEEVKIVSIDYLGWESSTNFEKFCFGPLGGEIPELNSENLTFDFSQAEYFINQQLKYSKNDAYALLRLKNELSPSTSDSQSNIIVDLDKTKIEIMCSPEQKNVHLNYSRFPDSIYKLSVLENSNLISAVEYHFFGNKSDDKSAPILTDPGLIINWNKDTWRSKEYEVFSWEQFPNLLIFDTANYDIQSKFFARLAYYIEKKGYRGKLLSDKELEGKHGYNAHDYSADSLAKFFNAANKSSFDLNQYEYQLLKLINNKIIEYKNGSYVAINGGIISISQESSKELRKSFINHECFHGLFFIDSEFRDKVASVYKLTDKKAIEFLTKYFTIASNLNYDINDKYLLTNEFMAYLMQQTVANISWYFAKNLAEREVVKNKIPDLADYIKETNAKGFVDAGKALSEYVNKRWGLAAGRVYLIKQK